MHPARAAAAPDDALPRRYAEVRAATQRLIAPLTPEDCQVQSMPDASPAKWHLAHVTWFFETFVLERFEPGFAPVDPAFRVLFNSYYEGVGERHPRALRGLILSPTLAEVLDYRAAIDTRLAALLATQGDDPALRALVELGLQHEQQHQELLLTDIKHALSYSPRHAPYARRWPIARVQPQPLAWVAHPGGMVEIGHGGTDGAGAGFAFDNESPRHRVWLEPFEIASRPVTHGDWLAFVDDGGYRQPALWLSAGWDWVRSQGIEAPLYWRRSGDGWRCHTLQGEVAPDPHTPACHLSFYEAEAYARWAGARLPTEAEWEVIASAHDPGDGHFAERGAFHPLPADRPAGGAPLQLFGDVWEWTASAYLPYPGFRPAAGAVGEYNGKFMAQQFVLRGGSCATPAGHVRASYRNFFPPEARWQFSGVRLARDAAAPRSG